MTQCRVSLGWNGKCSGIIQLFFFDVSLLLRYTSVFDALNRFPISVGTENILDFLLIFIIFLSYVVAVAALVSILIF